MKKYILFLLLLVGALIAPGLSRAATIVDSTGVVATSSDLNVLQDWFTSAAMTDTAQTNESTGTVIFYDYYTGTSPANSVSLEMIDQQTGATISLISTTTPNTLISGSSTLSGAIFSGDNIIIQAPHGSSMGNTYDLAGTFTTSTNCGSHCTYNYQPWFYAGDTIPPPVNSAANISFIGPLSSSTLPNFRNWVVRFNVQTSTLKYYSILINYGTSGSSSIGTYSDRFPFTFNGSQATAGYLDLINTIQKNVALSQGDDVWAQAELFLDNNADFSDQPSQEKKYSDIIHFTIDNSITLTGQYFSTSTNPADVQQNSQYAVEMTTPSSPTSFFGSTGVLATTTAYAANASCPPPENGIFGFFTGSDFYYAGCSLINYLFVPNDSTNAIIQNDVDQLQNIPPFSWFFMTNNQIAAAATGARAPSAGSGNYIIGGDPNSSTTQITPNNGVAFTIYSGLGNATNTFTLLPASLTSNSFLSDGRLVDDWYNFVLVALIAGYIIMLY